MKTRTASLALLTAAAMLPSMANAALAQDDAPPPAIGGFATLPPRGQAPRHTPAAQLPQWNGVSGDLTGKTINFTMVGTNPQSSNATTTVKVIIVPVKMVYGKSNGNMTFDPHKDVGPNGKTVLTDVGESPLFNNVNFTQGGQNLGTTQYIDAFQRGNFWLYVVANGGGYHVRFGFPKFMSEQTVNVPVGEGKVVTNPFTHTGKVGLMGINDFDLRLQAFMKKFAQVNPGVLPLFITDNIFLTDSTKNFYIGGYHSANGTQPGGQTYSYSTYVTREGGFAEDVSALSHELGEWMDDPFIDNQVNCTDNSIMEVGNPLVGHVYPYVLNGHTYNLQSLVFINYFGAASFLPPVNGWLSFQNDMNHVCPGQ